MSTTPKAPIPTALSAHDKQALRMKAGNMPLQDQVDLDATQKADDAMHYHIGRLTRRYNLLQAMPGGRSALSNAQRVEFDLIGGTLADARAAIAKAEGSAS